MLLREAISMAPGKEYMVLSEYVSWIEVESVTENNRESGEFEFYVNLLTYDREENNPYEIAVRRQPGKEVHFWTMQDVYVKDQNGNEVKSRQQDIVVVFASYFGVDKKHAKQWYEEAKDFFEKEVLPLIPQCATGAQYDYTLP